MFNIPKIVPPVTRPLEGTLSHAILDNKAERLEEAAPIPRDELLCCNCATCGKECCGPTHAEYAPFFALPIATFYMTKPYCSVCLKSAKVARVKCMACDRLVHHLDTVRCGDAYVCGECVEVANEEHRLKQLSMKELNRIQREAGLG